MNKPVKKYRMEYLVPFTERQKHVQLMGERVDLWKIIMQADSIDVLLNFRKVGYKCRIVENQSGKVVREY